ncbi:L,D-transpeptidase family protein [Pedobacter cryoconitis]|uniref:L,D-transpeptidase-like protein n=1 Tax=Pedobacter cryoconitis TaxID=188932 RepID=A0A327T8H1_9SPHI|nr:L,D-transpeptidase family protein [Pedobacter cryoconitis]RAJ37222.1 L,D-transpeptidase-like protein [Pedobacter cryoconitis]
MRFTCSLILFVMLFHSLSAQNNFKQQQLTFERVKNAYNEKWADLKAELHQKGFKDKFELHLEAYKSEGKVEIWLKNKNQAKYSLLKTYPFSAHSGILGPKTKKDDLQTPEGSYFIDRFNPESRFYLSLRINYPNAIDLLRSGQQDPGSDIYIHGNQVTAGCIPLTDDKIKEVYILAVEAGNSGQVQIPVHIFPFRMTKENMNRNTIIFPQHKVFWKTLQLTYDNFKKFKTTV